MIIAGGVNIYPAEIGASLARVPGGRDCAVFGIPDDEYGESVMAVVQPIEGQQLTPASLADALRRDIASYKVPRRFELVGELPREDSGKIFKRKLRAPYWEAARSEEDPSELQSLMRISDAVFCMKTKK